MFSTPFHIRDAGLSPTDADFIVSAFDASVAHLVATGNGAHWGPKPFSEREGFFESTQDDVAQSVKYRTTGEGERLRIFIAEVEKSGAGDDGLARRVDEQGRTCVSVGMLTTREDEFAQHINSHELLSPIAAEAKQDGNFVWIDVIVTDFRVGPQRKGAGAALVEKAKSHARETGKKVIYLDHWTGGTGGLTK